MLQLTLSQEIMAHIYKQCSRIQYNTSHTNRLTYHHQRMTYNVPSLTSTGLQSSGSLAVSVADSRAEH